MPTVTNKGVKHMNINKNKILSAAISALLALCLTACGGKTVTNSDGTKTVKTEHGIKVTQTAAKAMQTEKYETADFSITIPKGWRVTAGGANIYHTIRVSDPNEPLNGMYILLKAECLLHSQAGKAAYQSLYNKGNTQLRCLQTRLCLKIPLPRIFLKFSLPTAISPLKWIPPTRALPSRVTTISP